MKRKSHVEKVKEQYEKVLSTMGKFSRFGATDTEPDGELQAIIRDALRGKEPEIELSASFWQLYSGMKGNGLAAMAIGRSTRKLVKMIRDTPLKDVKAVTGLFDLWRVSW